MTGVISDIQRFAIHDGPGIRTTVFLKGCSARCEWCHNPESISSKPQLQYYADRCISCARCVPTCANGAHKMEAGRHTFDNSLCTACGACVGECLTDALALSGREETVEEVLRQILSDRVYYEQSGGGVTLSGGEPVLQGDFCEALLKCLKDEGIHTCLQTAGFYPYALLERLLPWLDLIMYDIKGMDSAIYSEHVHGDRETTLDNLRRLDADAVSFVVRTPVVAGVNDSRQEIEAIVKMLGKLRHLQYYQLIPYHGLGKIKYDILNQEFRTYEAPSQERLRDLERFAAEYVKVFNYKEGYIQ